jgi:hypothetical protein
LARASMVNVGDGLMLLARVDKDRLNFYSSKMSNGPNVTAILLECTAF